MTILALILLIAAFVLCLVSSVAGERFPPFNLLAMGLALFMLHLIVQKAT